MHWTVVYDEGDLAALTLTFPMKVCHLFCEDNAGHPCLGVGVILRRQRFDVLETSWF